MIYSCEFIKVIAVFYEPFGLDAGRLCRYSTGGVLRYAGALFVRPRTAEVFCKTQITAVNSVALLPTEVAFGIIRFIRSELAYRAATAQH